MSERYNPFDAEQKWQQAWHDAGLNNTLEDSDKPKYYVLEMFPYPSGKLHMGHVRNYTIGDVIARARRAQGYNVLHPMGWDSFGMPAENAAIQKGVHPAAWTRSNIKAMQSDLRRLGLSYDWSKEIATCEPDYYQHQQAIFLGMLEKGLAYQKESQVNWDPVDQTVLANEQVIDGKGWRSGAAVERRNMRQWFFKITDYADQLLNDLDTLTEWPEQVRTMQENWIGRSEGLTFTFDVDGFDDGLTVYTTRPDTIYGVTFCSVAPEHPLATLEAQNNPEAKAFIEECQRRGTSEADIEKAEKKGLKTRFSAKHPLTGEEVPIYIGNFVLMSYGSGAVMAVPAHDERDHAFAKKYNIAIKQVIANKDGVDTEAYTDHGKLVDSGDWTGLESPEAKEKIITYFEEKNLGKRTVNWRLRDWGISRQRYWGCPIPVVYCDDCGVVPVPEKDLPVALPEDAKITGNGNPLAQHPTWKHTDCPQCGGKAERETDTMDTFVDSSWYFARFVCANDADKPLDKEKLDNWLPVHQYIGGIEHAVLHLLYARFFTKALRDMGYTSVDEPFKALMTQGMVLHDCYQAADGRYVAPQETVKDADGNVTEKATGEKLTVLPMEKMSKSKNNGVDPMALIEQYGCDAVRLFVMFTAPPERSLEWSEAGLEGSWRFVGRVASLVYDTSFNARSDKPVALDELNSKEAKDLKRKIHKTIAKVTLDVNRFSFNTMVAACMELTNALTEYKNTKDDLMQRLYAEGVRALLQLMHPIAPHVTEELWHQVGYEGLLAAQSWPEADKKAAADDEITLVVQLNGKLRSKLTVDAAISNEDAEKMALDAIADDIANLNVMKCIVVPKRLVNIVAR